MDAGKSTQVSLGTVTPFPAIAPGHHLAPVALGPDQKIVFVPCPDWCTTNHVSESVRYLEDIAHAGDVFAVEVGSFFNGEKPVYTLNATIGSDPMSSDPQMRAAHVIVGDEGSVDAYLTPDMADETADDLEKLVAKLRENARTARLHNAAEAEAVVA
jgi:hypothetical protein